MYLYTEGVLLWPICSSNSFQNVSLKMIFLVVLRKEKQMKPILLVIFILTTLLFAEKTRVDKIVWDGAHFTYSLNISSSLSPKELFTLMASDSATLSLKGSADSVTVSVDGSNNRIVTTIMKTFGHRLVTVTDKKVSARDRKITLMVLRFDHDWKAIPTVQRGSAVYSIKSLGTGSELVYLQDVYIDRTVNGLSKMLISWQLKPFHQDILHLIHTREKK